MIKSNENDELFDLIAEYFDDIGEVKCLAVYLGFTKSSITYAQRKEFPDLRAMSKLFMKEYVAQYNVYIFIDELSKITEKMRKCIDIDKSVYQDIEGSKYERHFKLSTITETFPSYKLLIDMAFELLESRENIIRFLNNLHCCHFTDVNCYVNVGDHPELRKLVKQVGESGPDTDTYQIAHYRGKDACTMGLQCKNDIFEVYFELLCHWKEYSFSDQLNNDIIANCFLDDDNRRMAERIHSQPLEAREKYVFEPRDEVVEP